MRLRRIYLFAITATLCLSRPAFSQVNGIKVAGGATAQVLGGESPSVQVTDAQGKVLASIPIEKNPGESIYSESANTLYVVHNEKKEEHFISAVNLTTNRVDKQIKVGAGEAVRLLASEGGRRVFCYTAVKGPTVAMKSMFYLEGMAFYDSGRLKPPFEPAINVIDTVSNEVILTYDWLGAFREGLPSNFYLANELLGASDAGHLILRSQADSRWGKPLKDRLMVFSGQSSHPDAMIDPGGRLVGLMFSKDRKFLFAVTAGDKKAFGSLVVVDVEKWTSVTHVLSDHPTRLLRLGSKQEPWILGSEEMRGFSETGDLGDRRIPLNKPRKPEEGGGSGASVFLDGFPGETISLGEDHVAIQINSKNGGYEHKVALIDLKDLRVDAIVPTMTASQKTEIRTERILTAVILTAATVGNVIFIPNMTIGNQALAARPDGRFLYALDYDLFQVTVIDVQAAIAVKHIQVNNTVIYLEVSSDGKHLICAGKKPQQINLETNDLEN
jgi:DNA-binding beta-propeller fold protein YncE